MKQVRKTFLSLLSVSLFTSLNAALPSFYVKKDTWYESMFASLTRLAEQEKSKKAVLPDLGRSDFTLMAWIRTKSSGGTIIAKAPSEGNWIPDGKVVFLRGGSLTLDVGWVGAIRTRGKVNDGSWHLVAVTGRKPLKFFVDGKQVGEGELTLRPDPKGCVFKIGFCTPNFPERSSFRGTIDEVRIYGRSLSGSEIERVANGGQAPERGLLGYWPFENGCKDESGNGNDGRPVGVSFGKGKIGKGLRLEGKGFCLLPGSLRDLALLQLWKLLERDFGDPKSLKEMEKEKADGIWEKHWGGDLRKLARRYAERIRDEIMREEALAKASQVKSLTDLWEVRAIYHTPPPIRFPQKIPLDEDPALAGWWQFDQEKGTVAKDSSRHGRNGYLSEDFSFDKNSEPGRFGYALRFNGRSYVTIRGYKGILGTKPRTVCAWIKTKERRGDIVTWGKEEAGYYFRFGHIRGRPGVTPYGGYLYMRDYVNDDKWHHVAVVVQKAELPNLHDHVKLYLDGEEAVIDDIGLLDLWPIQTGADQDVTIGRGFVGLIDEVRIYERPLSEDEIGAIYQIKPRPK